MLNGYQIIKVLKEIVAGLQLLREIRIYRNRAEKFTARALRQHFAAMFREYIRALLLNNKIFLN